MLSSSSQRVSSILSLGRSWQKTQVAFKYRFHARLGERLTRTLQYPPQVDGQEDYAVTTKTEENEYIRKILHVKPHPETPMFPDEYSLNGRPKGRVYEKLPFKFRVEEGKAYSLCTCGYSSNQPFCDNSHKILWTTSLVKRGPKYRPIKYIADSTKDVWFCNCKQSKSLPLCDGTHKLDEVQKANSVK